jgi:hypothetical protein
MVHVNARQEHIDQFCTLLTLTITFPLALPVFNRSNAPHVFHEEDLVRNRLDCAVKDPPPDLLKVPALDIDMYDHELSTATTNQSGP